MSSAARLWVLGEAVGVYMARRPFGSAARLRPLFVSRPGRAVMSAEERQMALTVDSALSRARITCLWRAIVIATMLRRRGVAAKVRLSFDSVERAEAHAEVEVGAEPLRLDPSGYVVLR